MSKRKTIASRFTEDRTLAIALIALIGFGLFISTTSLSALSGYQSVTAQWDRIYWENPQGLHPDEVFEKQVSGPTVQWDADDIAPLADGWDNMNEYLAEIENPKFDHNIDGSYKSWWVNDTVSASNPTGEARRYEYAIDIYTMNVNFRTLGQGTVGADGVEFWCELQNNVDAVFSELGAEGAASYVIYAQTEEYNFAPDSSYHHIISPTTGNFEIFFLDTGVESPPAIQEGSDLNFDALTPFSHVGIKFTFADFGRGLGESDVVVQMIVELNILTVGRFDHVLTYVEGGDNDIAPLGGLGIVDGIGAAIAAGMSALGDSGLTPMLVSIAVIMGIGLMVFIFLKLWIGRKAAKVATGGII